MAPLKSWRRRNSHLAEAPHFLFKSTNINVIMALRAFVSSDDMYVWSRVILGYSSTRWLKSATSSSKTPAQHCRRVIQRQKATRVTGIIVYFIFTGLPFAHQLQAPRPSLLSPPSPRPSKYVQKWERGL